MAKFIAAARLTMALITEGAAAKIRGIFERRARPYFIWENFNLTSYWMLINFITNSTTNHRNQTLILVNNLPKPDHQKYDNHYTSYVTLVSPSYHYVI